MRACLRLHSGFQSVKRRQGLHARPFSSSRVCHERYQVSGLLNQQKAIDDVDIYGWVRSIRKQKKIAFAAVGDGSTVHSLQAILTPAQGEALSSGAAIHLKGNWVASSGKGQSYELQAAAVQVLGENDAETNPIQPKYQTQEFLRTVPHLRPRIPLNVLVLRLRSQIIAVLTRWFDEQDFVQCHTPIITSSDCEGAGEVFTVDAANPGVTTPKGEVEHFFRTPKYLTVSAQLHLEALSQALDRVWTLSPTFRAEKSDTPRHLSEFYMLEAELCFVEDISQVMDLVESMLRAVATELQGSTTVDELLKLRKSGVQSLEGPEIVNSDALQARWNGLVSSTWPRITYANAIQLLEEAHSSSKTIFTRQPSFDEGLAAEHERYIASEVGRGKPVFVTHYPRVQKPFYMSSSSPAEDGQDTAACFDLLVPDLCELVGGSLREHREDALRAAMKAKDVQGQGLEWYVDLRRYGSVPHGGFGLGFDRLLCYLAGVSNIRDVVGFPRWVGRCET